MNHHCGNCGAYFADHATLRLHVKSLHEQDPAAIKKATKKKPVDPDSDEVDEDDVADAIASITLERDEEAAIRSILGLD